MFDSQNQDHMSAPAKKQKKCAATFTILPATGNDESGSASGSQEEGGAPVNLEDVRKKVRSIEHEGLIWGEGSIEPFCFGLEKLVITA